MLIPITFPPSSPSNPKLPPTLAKISHDEFVLIELQGKLDIEPNQEGIRDGKFVGKFKIDESLSKPTLMIGHHLLEGKIATLPKPLAIIQRLRRVSPAEDSQMEQEESMAVDEEYDAIDASGDKENEETPVTWQAVAIVKRKIIFSKRPTPIVGRPK